MKRWLPLVAAGGMVVAACTDTTQPRNPAAPEFQSVQGQQQHADHIHIMLRRPEVAARARGGHGGGGGTGINYHGGPILRTTNVAAIYWSPNPIYNGGPNPGLTGSGAQDGSLVGYFLSNLGGSYYFNTNTTYYDGAGTYVQNSVTYTQFWADPSGATSGTVSDAAVQQEVFAALQSGALAYDPSTLYLVFSGPGVNLGGGFGTQYCAYHGRFNASGFGDVKYAVMPYDWSDPSGCAAQTTTPNGDPAADTEVNVIAHETEETTTDEDLNAWYDRRGYENADKCAWNFGSVTQLPSGADYNETVGEKLFLIQQNWINTGHGGCVQGY
jgi:hypothetical protein